MTVNRIGTTVLLLLSLSASTLYAQYYEREYDREDRRTFYVGYLYNDFQPRNSNALTDSFAIRMTRFIPTIGFRQGLVDLVIGYNRFSLRNEDKSVVLARIMVGNDVPVAFSRTHAFLIPLMLMSDYMKVENTGGDRENFNIGSIGLGVGMKYRFSRPQFELSAHAAEAVHWSFEGFSTGSGFSAATIAEATCIFKDVLSLDGIMLGYRFRYQTWNMNNRKFNYNSLSHGAFVGVMF